jgi:hypothetical protein
MSEEKAKTKTELLSEMRELQQEYARVASLYKEMNAADERAKFEERQLARLADYKTKYKFFVQNDGTPKAIDWAEVENLVVTSFGKNGGYALGFDQNGMEGLGCDYGQGATFDPMVEDETEVSRYLAREKRRLEFAAQRKQK